MKTLKMKTVKVRKRSNLDSFEQVWRETLTTHEEAAKERFAWNNALEVTRVSPDELVVVTTGDRTIRYLVCPKGCRLSGPGQRKSFALSSMTDSQD